MLRVFRIKQRQTMVSLTTEQLSWLVSSAPQRRRDPDRHAINLSTASPTVRSRVDNSVSKAS